jgi:acyl-CoA synthetase (AMP-forming)/AMP-acid ligase II/aryl carrier-like protein
MIEHQSLVNYLCWFNKSPLAKDLRRLPVITMPTFDASLKQLFAPLLRGAEVWLPPGDAVNQTAELLQSISTQSGVGLNCVPSLWAVMLDVMDSKKTAVPRGILSFLFLGGEQLSKRLVDRTFATLPHIEIWNLYGPTEATANASVGSVAPDGALTLGRPIANTQIYILDYLLQPLPIGVPGELFIGGAGIARGYVDRSELTAEKFVPNPFGKKPGARLYRTGDMARYLPDGRIEFLGRLDDQVKIRGFRIELGEVEAALKNYPGVREAVVVAREDNPGDKRLVAYLVPDQGQKIAVGHLREFLRQKLPDYMVPLAFITLEALPLTPNGKLDRRALPVPDLSTSGTDRVYVPPQNELEKSIIEICQQVFNVEKVGTEDDFFDLGGHSLLMMQVTNRLSNVIGRQISFAQMFRYPTIRTFVRSLSQDSG